MLQEFSQAVVSSISDWSPSETLRVGQDPGGSRVLEALVNATATSKAKKKLLRKLKGLWAVLAVEPGGNHVVESCFVWGVWRFPQASTLFSSIPHSIQRRLFPGLKVLHLGGMAICSSSHLVPLHSTTNIKKTVSST